MALAEAEVEEAHPVVAEAAEAAEVGAEAVPTAVTDHHMVLVTIMEEAMDTMTDHLPEAMTAAADHLMTQDTTAAVDHLMIQVIIVTTDDPIVPRPIPDHGQSNPMTEHTLRSRT